MDLTIIIIFALTVIACTVAITLCLQQEWRLFRQQHLVPRMRIPRDWLAPVLKRTRIARMCGDIYIGYCAATGRRVSGQLAHAHVERKSCHLHIPAARHHPHGVAPRP